MWSPREFITASPNSRLTQYDVNIEHFCASVIHPVTDKIITQYKKLKNNPLLRNVQETGLGKEVGQMAQGDNKTGTKGTNSIFVTTHNKIVHIPNDRVLTDCRLVVDLQPQKVDPN